MNLIVVQGTDAFLQSQKTFVDFRSLNPAKVPAKLNQGTNSVDGNKNFDDKNM